MEGVDLMKESGSLFLAIGADSKKFQTMGELGVFVFRLKPLLHIGEDATLNRLNVMATPADQIVVMPFIDLVADLTVLPVVLLNEVLFFEQLNKPKDRGEVAPTLFDPLMNLRKGVGSLLFAKIIDHGEPLIGHPDLMYPKPLF
jgi:hypothetical protein